MPAWSFRGPGMFCRYGRRGEEAEGVVSSRRRQFRTSDGRGGSAEDTAGPVSASGAQSPAAEACAAELLSAHPSVAEAPTALWPGPMRLSAVSVWSIKLTSKCKTHLLPHFERPLTCSDFPGICALQLRWQGGSKASCKANPLDCEHRLRWWCRSTSANVFRCVRFPAVGKSVHVLGCWDQRRPSCSAGSSGRPACAYRGDARDALKSAIACALGPIGARPDPPPHPSNTQPRAACSPPAWRPSSCRRPRQRPWRH